MTIQSENYQPESSPGAGDGKGWRLDKNGDFQIGTMSMIDGVLRTPHAQVHIDRLMVEQASIAPAQLDLPIHQVHGDRARHMSKLTDMEIVIKVDLPGVIDEISAERKSVLHQEIVDLIRDAAGVPRYAITSEATCRAHEDSILAQRIGALNLKPGSDWDDVTIGTSTINIPQPGGPVTLGDIVESMGSLARLGKPALTGEEFLMKPGNIAREFAGGLIRDPLKGIYREIMPTKAFLDEHVGTKLKPEVACALSMCAPVTGNGKVPVNNLPRPVDDGE